MKDGKQDSKRSRSRSRSRSRDRKSYKERYILVSRGFQEKYRKDKGRDGHYREGSDNGRNSSRSSRGESRRDDDRGSSYRGGSSSSKYDRPKDRRETGNTVMAGGMTPLFFKGSEGATMKPFVPQSSRPS